ncbi:hypothetical protein [Streptomyces sp. NPDC016172]|jgi:hypothetical protein|uniref:hypothetical protein n=1 Tax=Streptomyces TaxID=1883 RepID=UPI00370098AC
MPDLEAAKAAQRVLVDWLLHDPRVSAVGISGPEHHYVLKVNVVDSKDQPDLPRNVQGVPVTVEVTGRAGAQSD